jgi:hypothetical protein
MPADRGVLLVTGMSHEGQRITTLMIEEAFGWETVHDTFPLKCTANDKIFADLARRMTGQRPDVRAAGQKLCDALMANEPVRLMFEKTQTVPKPAQPPPTYPLFVRVEAPEAANLPWETLYFKNTFMALDPHQRWPIARLAVASGRAMPLERIIAPDLRIAVVIAAQDEKGLDEWAGISSAIEASEFPVSVLVLVSEEEVKDAVTADAARWQASLPSRTVEVGYTGDSTSLVSRVRTFLPNIIHIFCHGTADAVPQLELESPADRVAGDGRSSIVLGMENLKPLAQMGSLWLIVLNCCRGGKGTAHLPSFAQQLAVAGTPAVVAMRESVEVSDANLFSQLFYDDLLTQLRSIFAWRNGAAGQPARSFPELIWLRAIHRARLRLSSEMERRPDSSLEWTYPVVYVNRDELKLFPRDPKFSALSESQRLQLVAELDFLREARSAVNPIIDAEAAQERAKLEARIDEIQRKIAG